ncbi:MAG: DUF2283 domain-containing protein [Sphingomicrobium sp.]
MTARRCTTPSSTGTIARIDHEGALFPETDSLYIDRADAAGVETREVVAGVNVDIAADGSVVGIDIEGASRMLDLATLETEGLPIGRLKAA